MTRQIRESSLTHLRANRNCDSSSPTRRPIAARNSRWVAATARLARRNRHPSQPFLRRGRCRCRGGAGPDTWFPNTPRPAPDHRGGRRSAAILLCNLFDGMVAVAMDSGPRRRNLQRTPDRFADLAIFVGAGYAAGSQPVLGWGAAVAAITTAYVRALAPPPVPDNNSSGRWRSRHRMAL